MEQNPQKSPTLHLKDLAPKIDQMAGDANATLEDMVGGLVAACRALAELPLPPMSNGAGAAIKKDRDSLVASVEDLGMVAKKLAGDLRSAGAGSASAGAFKPRRF